MGSAGFSICGVFHLQFSEKTAGRQIFALNIKESEMDKQ